MDGVADELLHGDEHAAHEEDGKGELVMEPEGDVVDEDSLDLQEVVDETEQLVHGRFIFGTCRRNLVTKLTDG